MLNLNNSIQPKVSPTTALGQQVKELKAAGEQVFNMSIGENRFPPPTDLIDALKKHAAQVTYSDPQGIAELRKAVTQYYKAENRVVDEKNIVISPGSKAGIFILLRALEGDLLLIRPGWVSYEPQAKHWSKKVYWVDTNFENNYVPTKAEIKASYNQAIEKGMNPKIIILNYPNNPTSFMPSQKQLKEISLTCKELGLTVISDELYLNLCYKEEDKVSPSEFYPEGTVVIGGVSKFLSVAGWRIGWIVTPQTEEGVKLAYILKALASNVWSDVSTPIQYAIADYLSNSNYRKFILNNKKLHELRNIYIHAELKKIGINSILPKAGFYIFANLEKHKSKLEDKGIRDGFELQKYLLEKHRIASLCGSNFGQAASEFTLRMSTSFLDCNNYDKAESIWSEYLGCKNLDSLITNKKQSEIIDLLREFNSLLSC